MESLTPPTHPSPFTIPSPGPHQETIILLHGTSTNGSDFGRAIHASLLLSSSSSSSSSSSASSSAGATPPPFHNTRFVFPSGARRYTTVLGRLAHAWFDVHDFSDRAVGEHAQIEGLRESVLYLRGLVRSERALLQKTTTAAVVTEEGKKGRVFLGGFSQGAAMAAVALLLGAGGEGVEKEEEVEEVEVEEIEEVWTGFIGLSGWLPFRAQMERAMRDDERSSGDGPAGARGRRVRAAVYLSRLLGLDVLSGSPSEQSGEQAQDERGMPPVFLGHGMRDTKVRYEWGRQLHDSLSAVGLDVTFGSYAELEHDWTREEIEDIITFIQSARART